MSEAIQWKIRRCWGFNHTYIWSAAVQGPRSFYTHDTDAEKFWVPSPTWIKDFIFPRTTRWKWTWEAVTNTLLPCRRWGSFDYRPHDWRTEQLHRAICKITSGLCALICTFKPGCCYGSLILIQSISLTSFFQPSCWGDLRLVYISQRCLTQIVRRPQRKPVDALWRPALRRPALWRPALRRPALRRPALRRPALRLCYSSAIIKMNRWCTTIHKDIYTSSAVKAPSEFNCHKYDSGHYFIFAYIFTQEVHLLICAVDGHINLRALRWRSIVCVGDLRSSMGLEVCLLMCLYCVYS